ncbi:MAG: hypothetical protein LBJ87_14585 [bacterium]|jgi:hypothetical protein|nr:hypothetical protein [bacterium]
MPGTKPALTVVAGGGRGVDTEVGSGGRIRALRLNLLGNRVSENTARHYDYMVWPFLAWAAQERLRRFEELPVERVRHHRAEVASRTTKRGRQREGRTVLESHKALMTFFRKRGRRRRGQERTQLSDQEARGQTPSDRPGTPLRALRSRVPA